MSKPGDAIVRAGDPCPNGCTTGPPTRREPELLVESCPGSGDGEITCLCCWDAWQTLLTDGTS